MKILITGGAGFIGSHLTDSFIAEGHEVVIVDNLLMGRMENIHPEAGFYLMDIRAEALKKVFEIEKIDIVCHQAAQMDVRKSVADPMFDADVNVKGTLNILQNCVAHGVKKVLFASTGGAIYGEQDVYPCDEIHATRPVSPYGITKLCVEKYLFYYAKEFGLNYVILRYANVYGPRQNPHGEAGVVSIFTKKLLAGDTPVINGDGKQTRDYVYVKDVARANVSALTYSENDIFNVGTSIETDVNEIFRGLSTAAGSNVEEFHGPAKGGEQRRSVISYAKIQNKMGWSPRTQLAEGLTETVRYFREH